GYKVYIGGRWGKRVARGKPLSKIFTSIDETLDVIEKAILLYREQGKTVERFGQTIDRLGFENVENQLLSNDLLERKADILEAELHMTSGATC
ncbi:MAG: (4Fe-4S)-binding protein, partial [Clostridiales bacterium]|nr:(4Fe-4S)-binding protein [Clostridiales bacterium]